MGIKMNRIICGFNLEMRSVPSPTIPNMCLKCPRISPTINSNGV